MPGCGSFVGLGGCHADHPDKLELERGEESPVIWGTAAECGLGGEVQRGSSEGQLRSGWADDARRCQGGLSARRRGGFQREVLGACSVPRVAEYGARVCEVVEACSGVASVEVRWRSRGSGKLVVGTGG